MSNYFTLILDITGPISPSIVLEGGASNTSVQLVTATIGVGDEDTTGYQMLIWGDVDPTYDANIQADQGNSGWIAFSTSRQLMLSEGNGLKTVYLIVRDDVYNQSAQATDTINLDTSLPVVLISGPDVPKLSEQLGKNMANFAFSADEAFVEFKVKVVPAIDSSHEAGTQIEMTNGSTNMYGTGTFSESTPISCTINGSDFKMAVSSDETPKIVKVFVKDENGNWSI